MSPTTAPPPPPVPPAFLPLRTARLLLRPFAAPDAPALAEYRSDPEIARYQGWTAPYALADAQRLIAEMQGRHLHPPVPGEWNQIAIELAGAAEASSPSPTPPPTPMGGPLGAPSAPLIGDCVFRVQPEDARQASVGFTLARAHHHRGYATEAVGALISALFESPHLHRVIAIGDVENLASQRVLERLGMRREAHHVQNIFFKGAWGSEYVYAILASEWPVRRGSPTSPG